MHIICTYINTNTMPILPLHYFVELFPLSFNSRELLSEYTAKMPSFDRETIAEYFIGIILLANWQPKRGDGMPALPILCVNDFLQLEILRPHN